MTQIDFSKLPDWKSFERLTADVLEAEGFRLLSEPSVDRSGVDILAEEVFASHSGASRLVRWFVQCKHYSTSGKSLARKEIEEILYCFNPRSEEGLLIVADTDISEEASRVLREYSHDKGQDRLVKIWNRRELENRLLRHPALLEKYHLAHHNVAGPSPFSGIHLSGKRILIVSDSSPLSYQLFSSLIAVCESVNFITVWQYASSLRCELLLSDILWSSHDLTLFFLGDSFGVPIPDILLEKLTTTAEAGKALIMFPFFAWAIQQGRYRDLEKLVPVRLAKEPKREQLWLKTSRIMAQGDLSQLNDEAFVENQFVTVSPNSTHPITDGLPQSFAFIHSFEFLELKDQSSVILWDTMGNPLVVENKRFDQPVLYVNSCMHNCLTRTPILSPFEISGGYAMLVANMVLWALGLKGESNTSTGAA